MIRSFGSGTTMRGPTADDIDFTLSSSERDEITNAESVTTPTIYDVTYTKHSLTTYKREWDINASVNFSPTINDYTPVFSSITPTIASVDEDGVTDYIANGTGSILARTNLLTRRSDNDFRLVTGGITYTFLNLVSGSLAKDIESNVRNGLSGKSSSYVNYQGSGDLNLYSTYDPYNHIYTRNTNLWCNNWIEALTAKSAWVSYSSNDFFDTTANPYAGTYHHCTAITARHVQGANHFKPQVGSVVKFVGSDSIVYSRTIIGMTTSSGDIFVATLSSSLPAAITPMKYFPDTADSYIHAFRTNTLTTSNYDGVFSVTTNQRQIVVPNNAYYSQGYTDASIALTLTNINSTGIIKSTDVLYPFFVPLVPGDSGGPSMFLLNSGAIAVAGFALTSLGPGCRTWVNRIAGFNIQSLIALADANAGIASTGLTIDTVSLAGYPTY